jgi:hypothetical protein
MNDFELQQALIDFSNAFQFIDINDVQFYIVFLELYKLHLSEEQIFNLEKIIEKMFDDEKKIYDKNISLIKKYDDCVKDHDEE